jgi:hypothetical protein
MLNGPQLKGFYGIWNMDTEIKSFLDMGKPMPIEPWMDPESVMEE